MSKLNINRYDDLPYEKCIRYGAGALSNLELIAVIIRTGTRNSNCLQIADKLLSKCGSKGLLGLKHMQLKDYMEIDGIGTVKAIMLSCVGELSTRIAKSTFPKQPVFSKASDIADYYMEDLRHLNRERLILMLMDNKCRLIKDVTLSVGSVNQTIISPRDILIEALHTEAVYIILVHNHPSGDSTPSRNDIECTTRIYEAGILCGIPLIDHIIIGDNNYFSFKERELLRKDC
jgi:DNA repair protein RadC